MDRDRLRNDREIRELLTYLRDTFRDAAARIDDYLLRHEAQARPRPWRESFREREERAPSREPYRDRSEAPREFSRDPWRDPDNELDGTLQGQGGEVHEPLERLREEVRAISNDAADMDPSLLRLHVEAVTAETRLLQAKATDPVDQEIAARIMRTLTAIVSDHRPGHVYGLARHHQTDWEEMARRAREEIRLRRDASPS
jgi:hypothetical protein